MKKVYFDSGRYDGDEGIAMQHTSEGVKVQWRADLDEFTLPRAAAEALRDWLNSVL